MRATTWGLAGQVVAAAAGLGCWTGVVAGQTTAVAIEAYIDGRSRAVIRQGTVHWEHLDFDRPGRWNANNPTYLTLYRNNMVERPRFEWLPVWIDDGDISEPIDIGPGPFGSACDPARLTVVQGRGVVTILQQPTRLNQLTTVIEFNDNQPLGAAWYRVRLDWDIPTCAADFNCDETVNSQDFFQFLAGFFADSLDSDFNQDAQVNSQDLFDFLGVFFAGC